MSADDDIFESWFSGDLTFSRDDEGRTGDGEKKRRIWLDGVAVAGALEHFALPLLPGKDMDWLATEVRRSLAVTMRSPNEGPDRTPNSDTRKELARLGARAGKLWVKLFEGISDAARTEIWRYSFRRWAGEDLIDLDRLAELGEHPDYRRFQAAVAELDWLSSFLRNVSREIPTQLPRWTDAEKREIRTERAQWLVPVFLAAFDNVPNRWGTVFGEFYQHMVSLTFGEGDIPDFEAIITEARWRHRKVPATFVLERQPASNPDTHRSK